MSEQWMNTSVKRQREFSKELSGAAHPTNAENGIVSVVEIINARWPGGPGWRRAKNFANRHKKYKKYHAKHLHKSSACAII